MRIRKHRLKEMLQGNECYSLDKKGHSQLCLENVTGYNNRREFKLHRCLAGHKHQKGEWECIAVVEGQIYPSERYAYIDLQSVPSAWRRDKIGTTEYKKIEEFLKTRENVNLIRLSSVSDADGYWRKMGYRAWRCGEHAREYQDDKGRTRRQFTCRIGHPEDEEQIGGGKAKLLCGYRRDFIDRAVEAGYDIIGEIAHDAVPNKPCRT